MTYSLTPQVIASRERNVERFVLREETRQEAKRLLDEGWSYEMVVSHLPIGWQTLRELYPGYQWSKEQQIEVAVMVRQFNRLPNRLVRTDINLSGELIARKKKRD